VRTFGMKRYTKCVRTLHRVRDGVTQMWWRLEAYLNPALQVEDVLPAGCRVPARSIGTQKHVRNASETRANVPQSMSNVP
jgi:hypothetical protein